MANLAARLTKLTPGLTAKERGILVLGSLKNGTPEDPTWRSSMPQSQYAEFNRFIGLMNVANLRLSHLVTFIEGEVDKLELRLALWFVMRLWEVNLAEIDYAASVVAREPITESEHRKLADKAAKQYVPVAELARILAELERAWTDDDLQEVGWIKERVVKDAAWRRLCKGAEDKVRQAVDAGELEARGRGKRLTILHSSFDAWVGRPVTVYPDWAGGYEVVPDHQAARATADRHTLALLQDAIQRTPLDRRLSDAPGAAGVSGMVEGLESRLAGEIVMRWKDVRLAEITLESLAAEFDGEDPLKPSTRAALNAAKLTLESIARQLAVYREPLTMEEPSEADIQELWDHVQRWARS